MEQALLEFSELRVAATVYSLDVRTRGRRDVVEGYFSSAIYEVEKLEGTHEVHHYNGFRRKIRM